jgi:hypothetical protein
LREIWKGGDGKMRERYCKVIIVQIWLFEGLIGKGSGIGKE